MDWSRGPKKIEEGRFMTFKGFSISPTVGYYASEPLE